jgi:hypothetical protein
VPRLGEPPLLGSGDRPVLGTVERKGSSAEKPNGKAESDRQARDQGEPMGEKREQERSHNRDPEQPPLARLGEPASPEQRRQREPETNEPADEWNFPEAFTRCGHDSLAQRSVDTREGPESLAHDRDAVGPRHPSESGQGLQAVEAGKRGFH